MFVMSSCSMCHPRAVVEHWATISRGVRSRLSSITTTLPCASKRKNQSFTKR